MPAGASRTCGGRPRGAPTSHEVRARALKAAVPEAEDREALRQPRRSWSGGNVPDMATRWGFPDEQTDIGELLDLVRSRPSWHARAACRKHPEISWFPEPGESAADAVAVCGTCPVVGECLEWAMAQGSTLAGVWGGLTPRGRQRARRHVA